MLREGLKKLVGKFAQTCCLCDSWTGGVGVRGGHSVAGVRLVEVWWRQEAHLGESLSTRLSMH